jgi:hypothetical protein
MITRFLYRLYLMVNQHLKHLLACRPQYLKEALEWCKEYDPDFKHVLISNSNIDSHTETTIPEENIVDTVLSTAVKAQQASYVPGETYEDSISDVETDQEILFLLFNSVIPPDLNLSEQELDARALAELLDDPLVVKPGVAQLLNTYFDYSVIRKVAWDIFPYGVGDYESAKLSGIISFHEQSISNLTVL